MAVFTRRLSDDLTGLVKKIDDAVAKNSDKKMKAFVIYMSDEPDTAEAKLKGLASAQKISKTPLTTFATAEGPDNYRISADADVTVLMWNKMKVTSNHAFGKDKLSDKDVENVLADVTNLVK